MSGELLPSCRQPVPRAAPACFVAFDPVSGFEDRRDAADTPFATAFSPTRATQRHEPGRPPESRAALPLPGSLLASWRCRTFTAVTLSRSSSYSCQATSCARACAAAIRKRVRIARWSQISLTCCWRRAIPRCCWGRPRDRPVPPKRSFFSRPRLETFVSCRPGTRVALKYEGSLSSASCSQRTLWPPLVAEKR